MQFDGNKKIQFLCDPFHLVTLIYMLRPFAIQKLILAKTENFSCQKSRFYVCFHFTFRLIFSGLYLSRCLFYQAGRLDENLSSAFYVYLQKGGKIPSLLN